MMPISAIFVTWIDRQIYDSSPYPYPYPKDIWKDIIVPPKKEEKRMKTSEEKRYGKGKCLCCDLGIGVFLVFLCFLSLLVQMF